MPDIPPIEHVILLCMENRSFDHYLGALSLPPVGRRDVDGLRAAPPFSVPGADDNQVESWQIDVGDNPLVGPDFPDVPHGRQNMVDNFNGGKNDGFVTSYLAKHAQDQTPLTPLQMTIPMGYYTQKTLPVLYALAEQFTVCNMWFSSMLSSTWPNRKYLHSGRRGTDDDTQIIPGITGFDTTPIYAFLEQQVDADKNPLRWKSYFSDLPFLAFWYGFAARHALHNFATIETFVDDCRENTLPSLSIVDPPSRWRTIIRRTIPYWAKSSSAWSSTRSRTAPPGTRPRSSFCTTSAAASSTTCRRRSLPSRTTSTTISVSACRRSSSARTRGAASRPTPCTTTPRSSSRSRSCGTSRSRRPVRSSACAGRANSFWDALDFTQQPLPRGTYTGDPRILAQKNWASGIRERLDSPLGKFEALLERIFVLPELKVLDRRSDVYDTLGKMEDNVVTLKRMHDYDAPANPGP